MQYNCSRDLPSFETLRHIKISHLIDCEYADRFTYACNQSKVVKFHFFSEGVMITAKKRQEFRIKLQKRARRRAEKKLECMQDDIFWKTVYRLLFFLLFFCNYNTIYSPWVIISIAATPEKSPKYYSVDNRAGLIYQTQWNRPYCRSYMGNFAGFPFQVFPSLMSWIVHPDLPPADNLLLLYFSYMSYRAMTVLGTGPKKASSSLL